MRYIPRMPAKAIALSRTVGDLLRKGRERLGYTLRDVERLTADHGNLIPFSTLARIEQGRLDPGLKRLHALLRLYSLPIQAADDLLDLESIAGRVSAKGDFATLLRRGTEAWKGGDLPTAVACYLAMRHRAEEQEPDRAKRHEAILSFAVIAAKMGKHHIARQMLDELLLDKPARPILFRIFVQTASTWHALGSPETALTFVGGAEGLVDWKDSRGRGWLSHLRASIQIDLGAFDDAHGRLVEAARLFQMAKRPYDRALALAAIARLEVERGDAAAAVRAARRAAHFAAGKRFGRVVALAGIQEARARLADGKPKAALTVLNGMLSKTVASSDNIICFYAHFYLSKAYEALDDPLRSHVEFEQAKHFVRFVDHESKETTEVRGQLRSGGASARS